MISTACALNTLQLTIATFPFACIQRARYLLAFYLLQLLFATNKEISECVLCKHGGDDGDDDDNNNNNKN